MTDHKQQRLFAGENLEKEATRTLLPMLVGGLALIVVGMTVVMIFT